MDNNNIRFPTHSGSPDLVTLNRTHDRIYEFVMKYIPPSETASFEATPRTICSVMPQEFISPDNFIKLIEEGNISYNVHYIVENNLELDNLTDLTALPNKLTILGFLDIHNCPRLTALPNKLFVKDCLLLDNCIGLTSLSESLYVRGNLTLLNCTGLTTLSARCTVGGNLDITGCSGLSVSPDWLTTLGPTLQGEIRQVTLVNTGLSDIR